MPFRELCRAAEAAPQLITIGQGLIGLGIRIFLLEKRKSSCLIRWLLMLSLTYLISIISVPQYIKGFLDLG